MWLAERNSIEVPVNGLAGKSVNIRRSAGAHVGRVNQVDTRKCGDSSFRRKSTSRNVREHFATWHWKNIRLPISARGLHASKYREIKESTVVLPLSPAKRIDELDRWSVAHRENQR